METNSLFAKDCLHTHVQCSRMKVILSFILCYGTGMKNKNFDSGPNIFQNTEQNE